MILADVSSKLLETFFEHGFRVHPNYIGSDEKLHALAKWPERAASNSAELIELINEASSRGAVTRLGIVPSEGWMIVDIDVRDGKNGIQSFAKLCSVHGIDADPVFTVKSKSGGVHLYYKSISPHVKTVANVAKYDGVDIRGQGGFVYGPSRAGDIDTWVEGEYLLVQVAADVSKCKPFDDRKLFLEHTKVDEKIYIADDIRTRARALLRLPKGSRDDYLLYTVHEMSRAGYAESEAHNYLDWIISICDQDDDIPALRAKFHDLIVKEYKKEQKLVLGSIVELDVMMRLMTTANIYTLSREDQSLRYVALKPNKIGMTPYLTYNKEAITHLLDKYFVADLDGKQKRAGAAMLPRMAAILPTVDRRGFVPRVDVDQYIDPAGNQLCINTYTPVMTEEMAHTLSTQANGDIWGVFNKFLVHLFADKAEHALEMIAWMVHRPDRKMITAPIFISEIQGVGKDTLINIITILLGQVYVQKIDQGSQLIESKINTSRKLLLYIQEMQLGKGVGARNEVEKIGGRLKTLITESVQRCEEKYVQPFDAQTFCNVLIATNRSTVAQLLDNSDRRYNVFDCAPQKSLNNHPEFDAMANLSRHKIMPDAAAIWLRLRDVPIKFIFDKDIAPNDAHKARLVAQDQEAYEQFLSENLPDGFTQHLAAYMLSKSGLVEPKNSFAYAGYYIKSALIRDIEMLKYTPPGADPGATKGGWQFSRCRVFKSDNMGASWGKSGLKPTRPYVYIRKNSVSHAQLSIQTSNDFWGAIEEIYDRALTASTLASLTDDLQVSRESLNQGLESYMQIGDVSKALLVVQNSAKDSMVH